MSALVFAIGGAVTAAISKLTSEHPAAPPAASVAPLQPPPGLPATSPPASSMPPLPLSSPAQLGSGSTAAVAPATTMETAAQLATAPVASAPPSGTITGGAPNGATAKDRTRTVRKPAAQAPNSSTEPEGLGVLHLKP